MWILGEYYKPQKCKECDYSDFCDIIEVPSDEACEAIRACTKEFLYEKVYDTLYGRFTEKEN
jgi:hypothetical protein